MRIEHLKTCCIVSKLVNTLQRNFFFFLHLITIFSSFSFDYDCISALAMMDFRILRSLFFSTVGIINL